MWRKRRLIRCQTEIISPIVLFVSIPVGGRTTRAMKQTRRNLLSIRWCGWINLIFPLYSLDLSEIIQFMWRKINKSDHERGQKISVYFTEFG